MCWIRGDGLRYLKYCFAYVEDEIALNVHSKKTTVSFKKIFEKVHIFGQIVYLIFIDVVTCPDLNLNFNF